ncbi:hypothetical protein GRT41_10830 [Burkholderia pseudomallei]|nr:hypothetical protein [Burkholderia pseudomallei]MXK57004.1 hypothetical protein [Burkholderia pseudomallei]MXN56413.1 hypothetical protein [Burkholderia pseudomallei]NAW71551.1 hypothetical protein [Burkholderia pseudomallei]NAX54569.1 hypothetical protein [Burkholderia pseudomallei]
MRTAIAHRARGFGRTIARSHGRMRAASPARVAVPDAARRSSHILHCGGRTRPVLAYARRMCRMCRIRAAACACRDGVAFCEREVENALRIAVPGRHRAIRPSAQRGEES